MQRLSGFFSRGCVKKSSQEINPMKDNALLYELMKMSSRLDERHAKINELCKSKQGRKQLREMLALIPALKRRDSKMEKAHSDALLKDNHTQALSAEQAHDHMEWINYYRTESILADELATELRNVLAQHAPKFNEAHRSRCY